MPENMMNSAQKANSKEFNENYDKIFKKTKIFFCPEGMENKDCNVCPVEQECLDQLKNI